MDYLELGPSPFDEECVQVTQDKDYIGDMKAEIKRYADLLEKRFINLPEKTYFKAKRFEHEFGTYYEMVVNYDNNDELSSNAAFFIESNLPATWDDATVYDMEKEAKEDNEEELYSDTECLNCKTELTETERENGLFCDKCRDEQKKKENELWLKDDEKNHLKKEEQIKNRIMKRIAKKIKKTASIDHIKYDLITLFPNKIRYSKEDIEFLIDKINTGLDHNTEAAGPDAGQDLEILNWIWEDPKRINLI